MSKNVGKWASWIGLIATIVTALTPLRNPVFRFFGVQSVEASQLLEARVMAQQGAEIDQLYRALSRMQQSIEDVKGRQECDMMSVPYDRCPAVLAEKNRGVNVK